MSDWFALIDDKVTGPLTDGQLRQLAQAGEVHKETLVRLGHAGK